MNAAFFSHRPAAAGMQGMVASGHPLASLAGLRVLQDGGNAIDAAVAVAAALNVCEPQMSGVGGIGWMLIFHAESGAGKVLNFSGRAPAAARANVYDTYQRRWEGAYTPVVPGNVAGWFEALRKYGTMPAERLFQDAIRYADEGIPATKHFCFMVNFVAEKKLSKWPETAEIFMPKGRVPQPGEIIAQKDLAGTLWTLSCEGAEAFYRSPLTASIGEFVQSKGGFLAESDLRAYETTWEEPIETSYRGLAIRTIPPNASAFQLLELFNLLEGYDLKALGHNTAKYIHLLAEAGKLAVADRIAFGADPEFAKVPLSGLISKPYAEMQRRRIDLARAAAVGGDRFNPNAPPDALRPGDPLRPDSGLTTHFSVADAEGNVVAVTQTNGSIFGSGMVVPETGVLLNNASYWFESDPAYAGPNRIEPKKRFEMPLAPVHVLRDGKPILSIGTPGSYGILHTTAQMILNVLEFGADIQEAIEAPRFKPVAGRTLAIEDRVPAAVRAELEGLGHQPQLMGDWCFELGGGNGLTIDPETGALFGGADPRRDGGAIGY
jgi:gamma-glutamyltranspeptidase/glutathione hydrolase